MSSKRTMWVAAAFSVAALGGVACEADLDLDLDLLFTSGVSCAEEQSCEAGFSCYNDWCVADGQMRVSLTFDADSDFDLHVLTPGGDEVFWDNRRAGGGELDVDQCVSSCGAGPHVENVYFASEPADGTYTVFVRNFGSARAAGDFTIDVVAGDRSVRFTGDLPKETNVDSEKFTFSWPLPPNDGTGGGGGAGGGDGGAGGGDGGSTSDGGAGGGDGGDGGDDA